MTPVQIAAVVIGLGALIAFVVSIKRQNDRQAADRARREAAIRSAEQWYRSAYGFAGEFEASAYFDSGEKRWFVSLESPALVGRYDLEIVVKEDKTIDTGHWQGAQLVERWFRETHQIDAAEPIDLGGELDMVDGTWSFLVSADSHPTTYDVRVGRDGSLAVRGDEPARAAG